METRGCRHLHFISAIKSGSVTKVPNANSHGKPALRLKSLKDVYESEDAIKMSSNSAVELMKVKTETSFLPIVDRTLWKEDFGSYERVNHGSDDNMSDDSIMTLHQLKQIWRRKKRKLSNGSHSPNKVCDNLQDLKEDFDLKEPLIHWKRKLSQKTPKRKRKCSSRRTGISEPALPVKLEPILGSESFRFADRGLMPLVCVKSENPEPDSFDFPSPIPFVDVVEPNFDTDFPDEVLDGHVYNNQELVLYGDGYQEYFPDSSEDIEIDGCASFQHNNQELVLYGDGYQEYFEESSEDIEIDGCDSFQQVLCIEERQSCALNEVCYDHLKPFPLLEANAEDIVYDSDDMTRCQRSVVSSEPDSESDDKCDSMLSGSNPEIVMSHKDQVSGSLNDSHLLNKTSGQSRGSSGVQAHKIALNTELKSEDNLPPVTQTEFFTLQQSVSCSSSDATKDCWSPTNQFPSNLPTISEKQPPEINVDSSSPKIANFPDDYTLSAPLIQIPRRLTRKIIPPTSHERLCLAMNRAELHDDDEYKCNEKLFLEKTESNPPIAGSNIVSGRRAEDDAQTEQHNQRKVFISLSPIVQKARSGKRGSPLKRNREQPCHSRSVPSINTGCTSVKSCSKGAIEFSQLQMHDAETLAEKLLIELKSMKDIIEQKLLLNSSRNLSLRNDADEVVAAIKAATRVEENAKRSLSVMSRNCNRFCKIMSLTQDGPSSPEIEIPKKRRKIVFADEAGGKLCHVKFFENDPTSTGPLPQKLDNKKS